MTPTTVIFITFGAYMVLLLGIGFWGERRFGKGYDGFVSAERSLGGWVAAISAAASSESAWVMLSLSGLGWKHGWAAYWAAGGCAFGFIITSIFVVRQLRRSAARYDKVQTLGDYLAERLGDGKRALRAISSLLIGVFLTAYVVAQFTGAGKQMVKMKLMSYRGGVALGAVIVGIYVLLGGYAAVCWTDMIQGCLMGALMIALPIIALVKAGGFGAVTTMLDKNKINSIWIGGAGPTKKAVGFALTYFGFSLGYPGMPHSIIRYITVRDDRQAKHAAWIGSIYGTLVLFGSATFGIFGRVLVPNLVDHEKILPAFANAHFPPIVGGIILAGVSAAMMSTADSQLMMSATAMVHDVWNKVVGGEEKKAEGRKMVIQTRAVIGVMCAAALGLALMQPRVIDTLVLFAWGCLGAAFSPVIILCLYWRRFNWQGAVASLVLGPATIIIWQLAGLNSVVHGLIPGTALSFIAAIVVSLATAAPPAEVEGKA